MKKLILTLLLILPQMLSAQATYGNLSPLYIHGNQLQDMHGNTVVLHGVTDSPSPQANHFLWGDEVSDVNVSRCSTYFSKVCGAINNSTAGTSCNALTLRMEPAWTCDSTLAPQGSPVYRQFSADKMKSYTTKLYWKLILSALRKGLYVVMQAPDECPQHVQNGDDFQQYLTRLWTSFVQNDSVRKYSGQISIELARHPQQVTCPEAESPEQAPALYFQPIVDAIRQSGFTGILWVPNVEGTGTPLPFAQYPIQGYNIGYSVQTNATDDTQRLQHACEMSLQSPVMLSNTPWQTGEWSQTLQQTLDAHSSLSVSLASTDDFINVDSMYNSGRILPAPDSTDYTCIRWYAALSQQHPMFRPYRHFWTSDQGNGTFINPILNGDFPDIDVIRVGDVYYMVSTTMYIFPGATIMKSYDLVNWEYCCNPLQKIDDNDAYNLQNGREHYAQGQWATSLKYHDGKFYLYFISYGRSGVDNGRNVLLTCTDPEGEWKMQYLNEHYYDSGWMFDDGPDGDGYLYVACGIGTIFVNKLDAKTLKKISDKQVISNRDGLEGSHMYHIGEYYYLYLTTGGYWRGQTIYRSKNPMGPYEEMPNLNNYGDVRQGNAFCNNAIHQGGLVQTQTGEWWTIMFRDAGAIGRVPYLEPVEWVDGWPMIGNKGTDVSKGSKPYRKPNVGGNTYQRTYLPTSDPFSSLTLGKQWGWNHNADHSKYSLLERPGHLRLHTVNVTTNLRFARNSLTQRIMGHNPEGVASTKNVNSYGTIKMDVSGMMEGDVAGLSVYQDPYQLIGVTVRDGHKRLVYMQAQSSSQWNPTEKLGPELRSDTIYLRAIVNYYTSKSDLYYSYDNTKWTKFGDQMSMRFDLSIFVGQRFYIFNYATRQTGGYVDIDWFSTEPNFSEDYFYGPDVLNAYPAEEVTAQVLTASKSTVTLMPGSQSTVSLTCQMQSGNKVDVSTACTYSFSKPGILHSQAGRLVADTQGETDVTATYTDAVGQQVSTTFHVNVSYFPLTTDYLTANILGTAGAITERNGYTLVKIAKNGLEGWHYPNGIDLTEAGRYLVTEIRNTVTSKPVLRIYDTDDATSANYYTSPVLGTDTLCVVDLQEAAQNVDLSHVYYIGFSTASAGSNLMIEQMFFSNDGVHPTAVQQVMADDQQLIDHVEYYTTDGRRRDTLQPGINIVRRIYRDGHAESLKIKK